MPQPKLLHLHTIHCLIIYCLYVCEHLQQKTCMKHWTWDTHIYFRLYHCFRFIRNAIRLALLACNNSLSEMLESWRSLGRLYTNAQIHNFCVSGRRMLSCMSARNESFKCTKTCHFYCTMHRSAKRGLVIACRLSVCLSLRWWIMTT